MTPEAEHTDVGAYVLGLLEDADRRAFAAHLPGCPACTAELAELSGMAGVFDGVGPVEADGDEPAEPPAAMADLLRHRETADRKARRGTFVIGLAAAVALVAGGITVGSRMTGESSAAPAQAVQAGHGGGHGGGHEGHDPAAMAYLQGTPIPGTGDSGVVGGLVLGPADWGSHAALELRGIKGPLECELVAVSKTGEKRVVTGWKVPAAGYGVPGSPAPLYVHGGSALPPDRIDRFEVATTGGDTLLTVDV